MAVESKLVAKVVADVSGYKKGMSEAERATEGFQQTTEKARKATESFGQATEESADKAEENAEKTKKATKFTRTWKDALESVSPSFASLNGAWDSYQDKMDNSVQDSSLGFKAFKLAAVANLVQVAAQIAKVAFEFASVTAQMFDNTAYNKALEERELGMKKLKTALGGLLSPIVNGLNSVFGKIFSGLATVVQGIYAGLKAIYTFFKTLLQPVIDAVKKAIDAIKSAIDYLVNAIKSAINAIAAFFGKGPIFKKTEESADDASESIEGVGEAAEYAEGGLQGFDKLNTADAITGDTETVEDMTSMAEEWSKAAKEFAEKILGVFGKIADFFKNFDLGEIWESLKEKAGDAWDWIKDKAGGVWEGIKSAGGAAWDWIKNGAMSAWTAISSFATTAWNTILSIGTTVWNTISSIATTAWNTIYSVAMTIWNSITSTVTALWNGVVSFFTSAWDGAVSFVRGIIDASMEWFNMDWSEKWTVITETFKSIWDAVVGWLRGIFDKLFGWIQSTIDSIMASVRWVLDKVDSAKKAVSNFAGGIVGSIKGALGIGAASGDVIEPSDGLQYRVVGDNKRETEVISPLSTMKQAMIEALAESGAMRAGGSSGPREIVLKLDGKTLARATYDDLVAEGRRRGRGTIA